MAPTGDTGPVTGLQLDLLRVLWDRGEATALGVRDALAGQRDLAPTTVATLLKRLAARGLVAFRREGRAFLWRAVVAEESLARATVDDVAETVFEGDSVAFAAQLLRSEDVGPDELARIRALIDARERELGGNDGPTRA